MDVLVAVWISARPSRLGALDADNGGRFQDCFKKDQGGEGAAGKGPREMAGELATTDDKSREPLHRWTTAAGTLVSGSAHRILVEPGRDVF